MRTQHHSGRKRVRATCLRDCGVDPNERVKVIFCCPHCKSQSEAQRHFTRVGAKNVEPYHLSSAMESISAWSRKEPQQQLSHTHRSAEVQKRKRVTYISFGYAAMSTSCFRHAAMDMSRTLVLNTGIAREFRSDKDAGCCQP